jgi:hypothetical protein
MQVRVGLFPIDSIGCSVVGNAMLLPLFLVRKNIPLPKSKDEFAFELNQKSDRVHLDIADSDNHDH